MGFFTKEVDLKCRYYNKKKGLGMRIIKMYRYTRIDAMTNPSLYG